MGGWFVDDLWHLWRCVDIDHGEKVLAFAGGGLVAVDRERFERVYRDHYDAVLRYCLRRCGREDGLDAAAETFMVAWRRRDAVPEGCELPWLYGVARRIVANQRRSVGRRDAAIARLQVVSSASGDEPEPQVPRGEEADDVAAALGRLKDADREVILLAGWEELNREELAEACDCTPNAVTKRLNRALDRLGRELGAVERSRGGFFGRRRVAR
jgi:RNA polymerase sigma-70 factor (ECF subfamily)